MLFTKSFWENAGRGQPPLSFDLHFCQLSSHTPTSPNFGLSSWLYTFCLCLSCFLISRSECLVTLWVPEWLLSVWILSWVFKLLESLSFLSHFGQLNGLSLVWICSWVFKALDVVNFLSHFEQLNGFSEVWILSCFFKLLEALNAWLHFEQQNGFSSVWILSCVFKLPDVEHL